MVARNASAWFGISPPMNGLLRFAITPSSSANESTAMLMRRCLIAGADSSGTSGMKPNCMYIARIGLAESRLDSAYHAAICDIAIREPSVPMYSVL